MNTDILSLPQPEFDGVAEFWVDSLEDRRKLWTDPEFTQALAGKFFEQSFRSVNEAECKQGIVTIFVEPPLSTVAGYDYLFYENMA